MTLIVRYKRSSVNFQLAKERNTYTKPNKKLHYTEVQRKTISNKATPSHRATVNPQVTAKQTLSIEPCQQNPNASTVRSKHHPISPQAIPRLQRPAMQRQPHGQKEGLPIPGNPKLCFNFTLECSTTISHITLQSSQWMTCLLLRLFCFDYSELGAAIEKQLT